MKKEVLKALKYSLRFIPDKLYLKLYYFAHFHTIPDLDNPKTLNEKLMSLRIDGFVKPRLPV